MSRATAGSTVAADRLLAAAAAIGAIVALLVCVLAWQAPMARLSVAPESLAPFGSRGWSVDVTSLPAARSSLWTIDRMDSMSAPSASRHRVLIDGRPLAPAHAQHAEIAELGQGRHSFWNGALLLSMPDGVDVPSDARSIELQLQRRPRGWLVALGLLGAGAAALWCLLRSRGRTLARALSALAAGSALALLPIIWFDPPAATLIDSAPPVLLWLAVAGAALSWFALLAPRWCLTRPGAKLVLRGRRVLEVAALRWASPLGRLAVIALLLCSLLRMWAPLPAPAHHAADVSPAAFCRGRIQASDSLDYWSAAETLRVAGQLNQPASRRPLYPALLATESWLVGGHRPLVLLLNAALAGVALSALAIAVGRCLGPWVALGSLSMTLGYAQQFVAYTLTEQLGLALGAIALAQILDGFARQRIRSLAFGSLSFGVAMMARAGALLTLPAPALAALFLMPNARARGCALLACLGPLIAAWVMNSAIFRVAGAPGAAVNANVSYVTLGMAMGGDWTDAQRWLLESTPQGQDLTDRERSELLRDEALRRLRESPEVFLGSLTRGLRTFAMDWSTIAWGRFAERGSAQVVLGSVGLERLASRYSGSAWLAGGLLAVASLAALARLVLVRPSIGIPLGLLFLGIVASLPFIWIDGRWRALAPTWPVLAVVATLWLMPPALWLRSREPNDASRWPPRRPLAGLGLAALGLLLALAPLAGALAFSAQAAARPADAPAPGMAMIHSPSRLGVVILDDRPGTATFSWFGPVRMTSDEFLGEVRTWNRDVEPVQRLLEDREGPMAILQAMRLNLDGGLPRYLLLATDPAILDVSDDRLFIHPEVLATSPYLGGIATFGWPSATPAQERHPGPPELPEPAGDLARPSSVDTLPQPVPQ